MKILSGIQPSGKLHIGNYFGMMKTMISLMESADLYVFIVDLHALTSVRDGQKLATGTLEAAAAHSNLDSVVIDREKKSLQFTDPKLQLDFGAIAKGWAVEKVSQELQAAGYTNFLINAGGNVRCIGSKGAEGLPWRIAIEDPSETAAAGDYLLSMDIHDLSVVTSGINQRFYLVNGRRYHHLIDPDSLEPETRYLSVTVLTEDSALGDALSTALFNMDLEAGLQIVEARPELEAIWCLPDGSLRYSSGAECYRRD